jgi:hypothetical protein
MAKKLIYRAVYPVFSRQHNKRFGPGEVIEFTPNPADPKEGDIIVDFDLLVNLGILSPIENVAPKDGQGE